MKTISSRAAFLLTTTALLTGAAASQTVKVDARIPEYKSVSGVSGNIKSAGSDTMINLMTRWTESFKQSYPAITVEVEGKGSASAPPALISGAANFGPMSRTMKDKELDDFQKAFGYKPTAVPTSSPWSATATSWWRR